MIQIIILYVVLFIFLILAWNYTDNKSTSRSIVLGGILISIILIILVTFRDGSILPDYRNYLDKFNSNQEIIGKEFTLQLIYDIGGKFGVGFYGPLLIYALLSISLKSYAILKYAPFKLYSFCVWFGSFILLHDMIQIRAAVASGLLLILLPEIKNKKYVKCGLLIGLAFCFHRSSIIFAVLPVLAVVPSKWKYWVGALCVAILLNLTKVDIAAIMGINDYVRGINLVEGDIYSIKQDTNNIENMFSPYTFLQCVTVIGCIYRYRIIKYAFPDIDICIKCMILSLIIYSLSFGVVSTRIAELLSSCLIYLYPCSLLWYKGKYKMIFGKVTISIICLFILSNYIFLQQFIEI